MNQKLNPAPIVYGEDNHHPNVLHAYCGLVDVGRIVENNNGTFATIITFPYHGRQRTYGTKAAAQHAFEKAVYRRIMAWKRLVLSREFEVGDPTTAGRKEVWLKYKDEHGLHWRWAIQKWHGTVEAFSLMCPSRYPLMEPQAAISMATIALNTMNLAK